MSRDKSILRINRLWPETKESLRLIDPEILPYLVDLGGGESGQVTKEEIEAVLTGTITSHDHSGVYEPANANIQSHIGSTHAPTNAVDLATVKADLDIASAISLKHSNSLDHASGSDNQDLSNLVVKETGKSLVADTEISKIHSSGSDNQDLSNLVVKETGKSLVSDSLISQIHASGSDNQDLSGKQDVLVSGINIKTINNNSILGSGDIVISGSSPTSWGKYY